VWLEAKEQCKGKENALKSKATHPWSWGLVLVWLGFVLEFGRWSELSPWVRLSWQFGLGLDLQQGQAKKPTMKRIRVN
jgi:hypothetical protein